MKLNQKGIAPLILILLAALGIIVYLLLTNTASFKDRLFSLLYPKPPSHAEEADSVPGEILLKFKPGVNENAKENARKGHGMEKLDEIVELGVEKIKVPDQVKDKVIEALSHNPNIEFAEPNYVVNASLASNDPLLPNQWAMAKVKAQEAWDVSTGTTEIMIAVLDTGVDNNHTD